MSISFRALAPAAAILLVAASVAAFAGQPEPAAKMPADPQMAAPIAPPELAYTCPMHPQIVQARPGVCPLCRMALKPVKAAVAKPAEQAANSDVSPMDHAGMPMPAHQGMQGTPMENGRMSRGMCGCGNCMTMMGMDGMKMIGMEDMDHGSAPASTKSEPQPTSVNGRRGGRRCGC